MPCEYQLHGNRSARRAGHCVARRSREHLDDEDAALRIEGERRRQPANAPTSGRFGRRRNATAPPRIPPIAPAARMIPTVAPPRSRSLMTGPRTRKVAMPSTVTAVVEERAALRALHLRDRKNGEEGGARDEGHGVDGEDPTWLGRRDDHARDRRADDLHRAPGEREQRVRLLEPAGRDRLRDKPGRGREKEHARRAAHGTRTNAMRPIVSDASTSPSWAARSRSEITPLVARSCAGDHMDDRKSDAGLGESRHARPR